MKWVFVIGLGLALLGCKNATLLDAAVRSDVPQNTSSRLLSKGILRVSTTYAINNNRFHSSCSAALLHRPEPPRSFCVALTAAHCFRHMPENAEHMVEVIDGRGSTIRSFRVSEITAHPNFTSQDAAQTLEQAAFDVALIDFKCALPESIQPSPIMDPKQLQLGAKLTMASYERSQSNSSDSSEDGFLQSLFVRSEAQTQASFLQQLSLSLVRVDYPGDSQSTGVLTLENSPQRSACEGDAGGPVFFDSGNELFLVGTTSSGIGFCDKNNLRVALTASHAKWINDSTRSNLLKTVEPPTQRPVALLSDMSPAEPEPKPTSKPTHPAPTSFTTRPTASVMISPTAGPSIKAIGQTKPTATPTTKVRAQTQPTVTPTIKTQVQTQPAPSSSPTPTPTRTAAPKPTVAPRVVELPPIEEAKLVPPIPDDLSEPLEEVCLSLKMVAQSKTRVWGTVLKLIDKDSSEISDDSLKCELPNDKQICVVGRPVPTGTGHSRAVLSEGVSQPGCNKFYAGRTIYLYADDFRIEP